MTSTAPHQSGPHAWAASTFAEPLDWCWSLSDRDIDVVLTATMAYADLDVDDVPILTLTDVPLPDLADRLAALRETLISGRGFEVIAGLPVAEISAGHSAAVFLAFGAHLGNTRKQNAAGHLLGHVRNVGADVADPTVRIYQTNERQTFHTDSADVVGLLCLQDAESGGESMLVSASAIYNEMLNTDEALAHLLFEPIATDRRGEVPAGADPFFLIPVLNWHDDALTVIYQRQYIESAQRFEDAPRITPQAVAALDLFDEIANRPEMNLRMQLAPGDMQFVHNHSLLHDRTGFVDRPGDPRHLLRLWLSIPGDRELPEVFASRYGSITVGNRGGVL